MRKYEEKYRLVWTGADNTSRYRTQPSFNAVPRMSSNSINPDDAYLFNTAEAAFAARGPGDPSAYRVEMIRVAADPKRYFVRVRRSLDDDGHIGRLYADRDAAEAFATFNAAYGIVELTLADG